MTRVYEAAQPGGGTRLLVLGAGHYPFAQASRAKVPKLADIASAARSAVDFATQALTAWQTLFRRPLASVDLLINDATAPDGLTFACEGVAARKLDAPDMRNIPRARSDWLDGAGANDTLVFYCSGHGIWLPSVSNTFLASDFGFDPELVWPNAVSIDLFIGGMAEQKPREQWLIFDCCANQAPPGLQNARPAVSPLIESVSGRRKAMADTHGSLSQAIVYSASQGAPAFGRQNGRSRFMDVFIEACTGPGFTGQGEDGRWELNVQSLEDAMASYRFRVAAREDDPYYTFPRLTTTDAEVPPILMARPAPAPCTLLVTSEPPIKLTQCRLDILHDGLRIDGQQPGPLAEERFRRAVDPYALYQVEAEWPEKLAVPAFSGTRRALPPLTRVKL
ncbi:caspase family protein [Methylobacterium oryzihabitans]|uniref:Caspase family protein n=1 Tax=Methylobacterium oryzihabitans TaxID=2499852 RepID=A0A437P867_9HYPH|nr:caspase family protein [Methylobacterium oryzihabitans]RVU18476.1 hypothetical protein EOE48_11365 [Methylobacterium oryzihabitans]